MGLNPFESRPLKFVFSPIAVIAMMIMNLPMSESEIEMFAEKFINVLITAAKMKPIMNQGKTLTKLNEAVSSHVLVFLEVTIASANVIGTIINVLVSLTIVAKAKATLFPAEALQEEAAATTDEVSFIAVPAHIPKPMSFIPSR